MSGLHHAVRSQSCSTKARAMAALFPAVPMQVLAVSPNVVATPAATLFSSFPKKIINKTVGGMQTEEGTSLGLHVIFMFCKD